MTTRRNFLKGMGVAMAATPFAALTLGSKNAISAPSSGVCLRCSERETPCFCHSNRFPTASKTWPSTHWYESYDRYNVGDTYLNSLDAQVYTYTAGKDGYPNFWQPRFGLMCPACSQKARQAIFTSNNLFGYPADYVSSRDLHGYDRMLSIACNTWPPYSDKWEDICCCGHPWLKTATEDYVRWQNGESDQERENRHNYPPVRLWERYRHCGTFDAAPAVMGVDQIGNTLQYHYRTSNGSGHGVTNWNGLSDVMRDRQIHMCVIDPYPEWCEAKKFQTLFPGHVVLCQYRHSTLETPLYNTTDYAGRDTVFANRSYWYRGDHPVAYCEIARELECKRRCEAGKIYRGEI